MALMVAAIIVHGLALAMPSFPGDGLRLDIYSVASAMLWLIAVLFVIGVCYRPLYTLGVLVLPLAAMAVLLPEIWIGNQPLRVSLSTAVQIHVLTSVLAYALLVLAAFQSLVLNWQEKHLKGHRVGGLLARLPALTTQEMWLFRLIAAGFFILSLSLISGIAFVEHLFAQHLAHKTILSVVAWILFATLLWGRWQLGWRGRTAVRWCLTATVILMLAYFGSKLVLEEVLGRQWGLLP